MTARTIALHRQNPAEARGAGGGKELSGANQSGPVATATHAPFETNVELKLRNLIARCMQCRSVGEPTGSAAATESRTFGGHNCTPEIFSLAMTRTEFPAHEETFDDPLATQLETNDPPATSND